MKNNVFGLIYTGEGNPKMRELAESRAVAAVPFGGRYRCVDFILSSLVHTGVTSVGIIAQKNYHSLMDHLGSGKEWDLDRKREGLFILPPFMTKESTGVFRGAVDALVSCMGYVRRAPEQYVLLSGSHTVFNTSFDDMIDQHIRTGADITIMYNETIGFDIEDQNKDLRLIMDESGRVTEMELDPYRPQSSCCSCEVYLMDKKLLEYLVEEAYSHGTYHFTRDILLRKVNSLKIYGWKYNGFVARLDSVKRYFEYSMQLLDPEIREELFSQKTPIYTKVKDEVPARYYSNARVVNSMVADGCEIDGYVENSILFRGVKVGKGAVVKNSILLQATKLGEGVQLDHIISDKNTRFNDGRVLTGYSGYPLVIKKNSMI